MTTTSSPAEKHEVRAGMTRPPMVALKRKTGWRHLLNQHIIRAAAVEKALGITFKAFFFFFKGLPGTAG